MSTSSSRARGSRASALVAAARHARRRRSGARSRSARACCRNPILGVTGTNGKTTTTALLGEIFRAAGRARRGGGEHRPPADVARRAVRRRRLDRLRALVVPARGHADAAPARRGAPQPGARPPRPARHVRGVRRREARASSSTSAGGRRRRARAGSARCPAAGRRVEFAGDDPLPAEPAIPGRAQPRERSGGDGRRACGRRRGRRDRRALARSRASRTASRTSATMRGVRYVNDSKATNVAAARRALARSATRGCTSILGGLGKRESYAPLAADARSSATAPT